MGYDTGHQYEYDRTKLALDNLKRKIQTWLKSTYSSKSEAEHTYQIMVQKVEKIVKRQPHEISWVTAGHPDWHGKYYHFLSKWIKLENELGIITAKMFTLEDDE